MKIIALYNIKGGVGKTAGAVNISTYAAANGFRVLIWDLDPQGAASFYLRSQPVIKGGANKLLKKNKGIVNHIKPTHHDRLDIIPADFTYRNMDMLLDKGKYSIQRLHQLLETLPDDYDYIFIDCPPSISLVSENIFNAADYLLVPTIPTILSLRTLVLLHDYFNSINLPTQNILPFFSMVEKRKKLHSLILSHPPDNIPTPFETYIPYSSDVEKMGIHQSTLSEFAPYSNAAKAFEYLWEELRLKLLCLY